MEKKDKASVSAVVGASINAILWIILFLICMKDIQIMFHLFFILCVPLHGIFLVLASN